MERTEQRTTYWHHFIREGLIPTMPDRSLKEFATNDFVLVKPDESIKGDDNHRRFEVIRELLKRQDVLFVAFPTPDNPLHSRISAILPEDLAKRPDDLMQESACAERDNNLALVEVKKSAYLLRADHDYEKVRGGKIPDFA